MSGSCPGPAGQAGGEGPGPEKDRSFPAWPVPTSTPWPQSFTLAQPLTCSLTLTHRRPRFIVDSCKVSCFPQAGVPGLRGAYSNGERVPPCLECPLSFCCSASRSPGGPHEAHAQRRPAPPNAWRLPAPPPPLPWPCLAQPCCCLRYSNWFQLIQLWAPYLAAQPLLT